MTYKSAIGKIGEDIACRFLIGKGYRIIERNYRRPMGEIDIVTLAPDKTLVLAEVKTVNGPDPRFTGEDEMTAAKIKKFKRISEIYAQSPRGRTLIKDDIGWRMDFLSLTIDGERCTVRHYENIT